MNDLLVWPEFINRFSRLIFWAIKYKINKLQITIPDADIHDIYQQVLLSIWRKQKLKTIKNTRAISSWIFTVTKNSVIDYIRNKNFIPEQKFQDVNSHNLNTPRSEALHNELSNYIKIFLNKLPIKERRIATLNFLYELEYFKIAKIVNLPAGTVSSFIKRTKENLKQHLLKKGYCL